MERKCFGNAIRFFILIVFLILVSNTALKSQVADYFEPIPQEVPSLKDNPITPEKIELGKKLYFDPRLSGSGLISCNTCHNLSMSGDDNLPTSVGHGWAKGPRNAPIMRYSILHNFGMAGQRISRNKPKALFRQRLK